MSMSAKNKRYQIVSFAVFLNDRKNMGESDSLEYAVKRAKDRVTEAHDTGMTTIVSVIDLEAKRVSDMVVIAFASINGELIELNRQMLDLPESG